MAERQTPAGARPPKETQSVDVKGGQIGAIGDYATVFQLFTQASPSLSSLIRVQEFQALVDERTTEHPVLSGVFESGAPNALLAATRPERVQSMVWLEPNARCAWAPDYPWGRKPEDLEARAP